MKTHMPNIPNAIRELRLRHEPPLTQEDLGAMIGVAGTLIARYERGDAVPCLTRAFEIALALRVPVDRVFYALHDHAGDRVTRFPPKLRLPPSHGDGRAIY